MVSDLQLIKNVKEKQDSESFNQLLERHTGIYNSIVNKYSVNICVNKDELIQDKNFNIYQYVLDYDPDRQMKFSSYIGQRIKYQCQTLISKTIPHIELDEGIPFEDCNKKKQEEKEILSKAFSILESFDDKRVAKIFKLRHSPDNKKETPWWKIGRLLGISTETARTLYYKHLEILIKKVKQEIK
jgi:RNA polymerase sigma factor (sigma-70 family)